jgi:uncharacterized protein (TIRG00374 family)
MKLEEDRPPTFIPHTLTPPVNLSGLFKHPHQFYDDYPRVQDTGEDLELEPPLFDTLDITAQPTLKMPRISSPISLDNLSSYDDLDEQLIPELDTHRMSNVELMQISGLLRAVRIPETTVNGAEMAATTTMAPDEWAQGIKEFTGSMRAIRPETIAQAQAAEATPVKAQTKPPAWKVFLAKPAVKVVLGGLVGIGMLALVFRFVNIPTAAAQLKQHLGTPHGLLMGSLAALFFILAFSIRGTRWSFFVRPIQKVSPIKTIQIYWIGIFVNVLLPVQGGEVTKSILLKRVTGLPVSQSLPTVAMDKALDLMPALIIMAIVPFIPGIHMNLILWGVLALVGSILIGVIFVVALTAWNRAKAVAFIKFMSHLLPAKFGTKIEGFAMGFVDSLLAAASRPQTFIPAVLLTCLAVTCDGLFAMFAFWAVGLDKINFGMSIFGYTVFNMFTILPTPPGQVGWNEMIGKLVFSDLLGFDKTLSVNMFLFSHPLTALIMATMALINLSALGIKFSSLTSGSSEEKTPAPVQEIKQPVEEREMVSVAR